MEDLARHRNDRALKARRTGGWGAVYQGIYALVQLVGLGMLVRYVGKEQYGMWMTILAITSWLPLANLGQASTLLTKLGAVALTDRRAARRIFSASVLLVLTVSATMLVALVLVGPFLPWDQLLNAGGPLTRPVVGATALAALLVALASVPAIHAGFAIFAHQRGDLVHMTMSAGSMASLGAMGVAIWLSQPLWLVGALSLTGPLLGGLALWAFGIGTDLVPRPARTLVDRHTLHDVISAGLLFFLIDAIGLMLLRTPDVIVARLYGADAVGPFASVGRLPLLMIALFQAILLPFWPALGEAAHRADHEWIRQTAGRTLVLVLAIWATGAAGIWIVGGQFVELWTGEPDFSSPDLIAAACVQSLGLGLLAWLSVLLGALSLQRLQVVTSGVAALVFLPLAFLCGEWLGPVGVAVAQAGALLFIAVPLGAAVLYRNLVTSR